MKKKIIAASLAVIMAAGLYACDGKTDNKGTESDAETVSSTLTETVTETPVPSTVSVTTTEPATSAPTTTSIVTTTKKVAETVKKVVTTKAATTEPESETEHRTRVNSFLRRWTKDDDINTELRYGVVHKQIITTYYEENEDGETVVVKEEITADVVDRTLFYASYNDMLPAAKKNRETYRSEINEVLRIINGYRAEGGLDPVRLNEELTIVACVRAEEIAWSGNHTHTRPNLQDCFSLMRNNGFPKGLAGENIGWGFSEPDSVCEAWKASQTHYENIMNPKFTEIGIGVAADPKEGANLCWSQYFYEG